jgi:hypothetical protein
MQLKPKVDPEVQRYAQFGRASLIPGIQKSIEFLQEMLNELRTRLVAAESQVQSDGTVREYRRKVGRPRKYTTKARRAAGARGGKSGWSTDPEERKLQMAERRSKWSKDAQKKMREGTQGTKNHPRNPEHPGHKAWLAKIARAKKAKRRERAQTLAVVA